MSEKKGSLCLNGNKLKVILATPIFFTFWLHWNDTHLDFGSQCTTNPTWKSFTLWLQKLIQMHSQETFNERYEHANNIQSNVRGRFRKILGLSQNIWSLKKMWSPTINEGESEKRLEENQSKLWLCKYEFNYGKVK